MGFELLLSLAPEPLPALRWWTAEDELFFRWCSTRDGRTLEEYREQFAPMTDREIVHCTGAPVATGTLETLGQFIGGAVGGAISSALGGLIR